MFARISYYLLRKRPQSFLFIVRNEKHNYKTNKEVVTFTAEVIFVSTKRIHNVFEIKHLFFVIHIS